MANELGEQTVKRLCLRLWAGSNLIFKLRRAHLSTACKRVDLEQSKSGRLTGPVLSAAHPQERKSAGDFPAGAFGPTPSVDHPRLPGQMAAGYLHSLPAKLPLKPGALLRLLVAGCAKQDIQALSPAEPQ